MPLDGGSFDEGWWWLPPEDRRFWYTVAPAKGPRGGCIRAYKGRYQVDVLIGTTWTPMCSLVAPTKTDAYGVAAWLVLRFREQP